MKKFLKRFLVIMLVILVIIQFIRPAKNTSAGPWANDISSRYPIPDTVNKIFQVACYDCHSNNTRYPWYSNIQPVYFWLANHVKDGKAGLNFSEFATYSLRKQFNRFKGIASEVKDGGMPLPSYLWIHTDAKLSDDQKNMIITWANSMQDTLKAKYPVDSLVKKQG